ncbi:MAG: TIGR02391 family protein [Anaerolineales bacterium]
MEAWQWLKSENLIADVPGSQGGCHFISRRGRSLKTKDDFKAFTKANLLPRRFLHPEIATKARAPFVRGEYDTAVFLAFKEVEMAVRKAGDFLQSDVGVPLMRRAFDKENGPLRDTSLPEPEREAMAHLFAEAIALYKNAQSPRNVDTYDPSTAASLVLVANHLLTIVAPPN